MGNSNTKEAPIVQLWLNGALTPDRLRAAIANNANINQHGIKGETALTFAAKHGDLPSVKLLIEHGASPLVRSRHHNRSPLHWALAKKYERVAIYLYTASEQARAISWEDDALRRNAVIIASRRGLHFLLYVLTMHRFCFDNFDKAYIGTQYITLDAHRIYSIYTRALNGSFNSRAQIPLRVAGLGLKSHIWIAIERGGFPHHAANSQGLRALFNQSHEFVTGLTPDCSRPSPSEEQCHFCQSPQCLSNSCVLVCSLSRTHQLSSAMSALVPDLHQRLPPHISNPQQTPPLPLLPPEMYHDLCSFEQIMPPPVFISQAVDELYQCTRHRCVCNPALTNQCYIYPPVLSVPIIPLSRLKDGEHRDHCGMHPIEKQTKHQNNPHMLDIVALHTNLPMVNYSSYPYFKQLPSAGVNDALSTRSSSSSISASYSSLPLGPTGYPIHPSQTPTSTNAGRVEGQPSLYQMPSVYPSVSVDPTYAGGVGTPSHAATIGAGGGGGDYGQMSPHGGGSATAHGYQFTPSSSQQQLHSHPTSPHGNHPSVAPAASVYGSTSKSSQTRFSFILPQSYALAAPQSAISKPVASKKSGGVTKSITGMLKKGLLSMAHAIDSLTTTTTTTTTTSTTDTTTTTTAGGSGDAGFLPGMNGISHLSSAYREMVKKQVIHAASRLVCTHRFTMTSVGTTRTSVTAMRITDPPLHQVHSQLLPCDQAAARAPPLLPRGYSTQGQHPNLTLTTLMSYQEQQRKKGEPMIPLLHKDKTEVELTHTAMCLCGSNTLPYVSRELSKCHASLSTNGDGLRIWKHGPGKGFDHHKASDPSHLMPFTPHTVLFYKPSKRGQRLNHQFFDYGFYTLHSKFHQVSTKTLSNDACTSTTRVNATNIANSASLVNSEGNLGSIVVCTDVNSTVEIPVYSTSILMVMASFHRILQARYPHYQLLTQWYRITTRIGGALARLAERRSRQRANDSEITLLQIYSTDLSLLQRAFQLYGINHLDYTPYLIILQKYITLRIYRLSCPQYNSNNMLSLLGTVFSSAKYDMLFFNTLNNSTESRKVGYRQPDVPTFPANVDSISARYIEQLLTYKYQEDNTELMFAPPQQQPQQPQQPPALDIAKLTQEWEKQYQNAHRKQQEETTKFTTKYPSFQRAPNGRCTASAATAAAADASTYGAPSSTISSPSGQSNTGPGLLTSKLKSNTLEQCEYDHIVPPSMLSPYYIEQITMLNCYLATISVTLKGFIQQVDDFVRQLQPMVVQQQQRYQQDPSRQPKINYAESCAILNACRSQAIRIDQWISAGYVPPHYHRRVHSNVGGPIHTHRPYYQEQHQHQHHHHQQQLHEQHYHQEQQQLQQQPSYHHMPAQTTPSMTAPNIPLPQPQQQAQGQPFMAQQSSLSQQPSMSQQPSLSQQTSIAQQPSIQQSPSQQQQHTPLPEYAPPAFEPPAAGQPIEEYDEFESPPSYDYLLSLDHISVAVSPDSIQELELHKQQKLEEELERKRLQEIEEANAIASAQLAQQLEAEQEVETLDPTLIEGERDVALLSGIPQPSAGIPAGFSLQTWEQDEDLMRQQMEIQRVRLERYEQDPDGVAHPTLLQAADVESGDIGGSHPAVNENMPLSPQQTQFAPYANPYGAQQQQPQQPQQPQQQQQSPEIPWYMQRREYNVDELPSVPPANRHMEQQRDSASLPSTPQQQQQLNSANINYA